ncbi:MAG: sigma-70 family RNA polymerase sigma factor [Chloroflexia bacterium]|nr:sigma-70 family RNA polymerase sigma factor [Chloroflexia bacterium]
MPRSGQATWEAWSAGAVDDADLVARAQADRQAFAALYRRYLDPIHRYCYRRLGSREAAEDATSLVFTKALVSLPTYRAGSFRSWLFSIAYHVITDDLRARRVVAELNAATEVPDREPMPEEALMAAESHSSVVQLLDHLSPGQRRVVELRLAGLTGREVAEVLGCSLPAVKIAQVRAYSRLRDLVTDPAWEAGHHGDR